MGNSGYFTPQNLMPNMFFSVSSLAFVQDAFHVRPRQHHISDARHASILLSRWEDGGVTGIALPGEGVHVRRHAEIRLWETLGRKRQGVS